MKPFFFLGSLVPLAFVVSLAACSSSNDGTGNATDASTSDTGAAEGGSHDSGNVPSDGSTNDVTAPLDASSDDASTIDGGPIDSSPGNTDGATAACSTASDCVLYSSACDTCACIPLGKNDPKPTCTGTIVTCFIDPCEGKTATCDNTGHCGGN